MSEIVKSEKATTELAFACEEGGREAGSDDSPPYY